jgi:fructosamine-3-kinase
VALPGAFRAGYTSVRPWPEGFDKARPVYQMLFLCTWSRVCRAPHLADLALEVGRWDAG